MNLKKRHEISNYIINISNHSWSKTIRILSIAYLFLTRIIRRLSARTGEKNTRWKMIITKLMEIITSPDKQRLHETVSCLPCGETETVRPNENGANKTTENIEKGVDSEPSPYLIALEQFTDKPEKIQILDIFSSGIEAKYHKYAAIYYFLKKATIEAEHFMSKKILKKHSFKEGDIRYSKTRWLETNSVRHTLGNQVNILDLNIQQYAPLIDRYSPIAVSIAYHVHNNIANHMGVDRSYLLSLRSVFIWQGQALFKSIVGDCIKCRIKLKARYYKAMGPLSSTQLSFGGVGRYIALDMSGHYWNIANLKGRTTRSKTNKIKVWLLHTVCLVSNYSNMTVLESYDTEAFVQAMHRLACATGYPEICYMDNSHTEIKGSTQTKFSMKRLINTIYSELGITIKLCGAGGESHARNGRIERRIGLAKNFFTMKKAEITMLSPLGFESLAKTAACFLNNLPLATRKRFGGTLASNLITPSSFLLGRDSGHRAPGGIPQIMENRGHVLAALGQAQEGMLQYFCENIGDLLLRDTWTTTTITNLQIGDCVLFQKETSALTTIWKLGRINNIEEDADGVGRILEIAYVNASEAKLPLKPGETREVKVKKRYTRRSCHTIVKIHAINEPGINKDLAQLNKLLNKDKYKLGLKEEDTERLRHIEEAELNGIRQLPIKVKPCKYNLRVQLQQLLE